MTISDNTSLDMSTINDIDTAITPAITDPSGDASNTGAAWFSTEQPKFQVDPPMSADDQCNNELKKYLENPSDLLKSFIGDIGDLTINEVIKKIENALASTLNTNAVYGMVSSATPDDLESALLKAASYRSKLKKEAAVKKDEDFYKLSKFLITKK